MRWHKTSGSKLLFHGINSKTFVFCDCYRLASFSTATIFMSQFDIQQIQAKHIALIYAASENDVIGKDNDIPWRLSADLKRFKALTTGYPIIMGRKTFESLGRPLPKRRNIVVTRNSSFQAEGIEVAHSLEAALELCKGEEKIFVIGGAGLFAESIEKSYANRIYFTRVHAEVDGDVFCPLPEGDHWQIQEVASNQADEKNEFAYTYITLDYVA